METGRVVSPKPTASKRTESPPPKDPVRAVNEEKEPENDSSQENSSPDQTPLKSRKSQPVVALNGVTPKVGSQHKESFSALFTFRFWFGKKFQLHRINGLVYLIMYAFATYYYLVDYDAFLRKPFYLLPICGWLQAVIAACTFTFLPSTEAPGYVATAEKGALSYIYILENIFFSGQLVFAWMYFDDRFYLPFFRKTHVLELILVFLPHMPFIRGLVPKTHFRAAYSNDKKMSSTNMNWFNLSTLVTKIFYMFAKHYAGFLLNYMRYLGRIGPEEQKMFYGFCIGGCWGTTISMFIHTLKFKGFISAKTGSILYQISYPWMIYFLFRIVLVNLANLDLALVATVGLLMNNDKVTKRGRPVWHIYQVALMVFMSRGVVHNLF